MPVHGVQPRRARCHLLLLIIVVKALGRYRLLEAPRLRLESSLLLLLLLLKDDVIEPWVLQSIVSADAKLRPNLEHALNQIDAGGINGVKNAPQILGSVHVERGLVLWQLRDSRPRTLRGSAHDAEYPDNLVFVCRTGEQWSSRVHFSHDASS